MDLSNTDTSFSSLLKNFQTDASIKKKKKKKNINK